MKPDVYDTYRNRVWSDEPCDRTEGHVDVYEKYEQLTGEKLCLENVVLVEENEPDTVWIMKDYIVSFCPDGNYIHQRV